jgi:hypothetical protein
VFEPVALANFAVQNRGFVDPFVAAVPAVSVAG